MESLHWRAILSLLRHGSARASQPEDSLVLRQYEWSSSPFSRAQRALSASEEATPTQGPNGSDPGYHQHSEDRQLYPRIPDASAALQITRAPCHPSAAYDWF